MITQVFIIIFSAILLILAKLFSAINFIIPQQIPNAFNTFFSYVRIGDGLFPFLGDAMLAIFTLLSIWAFLYSIKIILFAFSAIPWIGKVLNLPTHTITTTSNSNINTIVNDDGTTTSKIYKNNSVTDMRIKRKRWDR